MDEKEKKLREDLEFHLDTLRRNLEVVSMEDLKAKYAKPFKDLKDNICKTATAYTQYISLGGIRVKSRYGDEAVKYINEAIKDTPYLKKISEAAFERQDMDEIAAGRPRMMILNRIDLADPNKTAIWAKHFRDQGMAVIQTDSRAGTGTQAFSNAVRALLADKIEQWNEKGLVGKAVRVMVVGIPNVGKSTFINRILGRKSAKAADRPGVTRGSQWFRVDSGIDLLDTPGILWPKFDDERVGILLACTGAIKDDILDVETLGCKLMELLSVQAPQTIVDRYSVSIPEEECDFLGYELLQQAGKRRGFLLRGGEIDTERMARILLDEFGRITLEMPAAAEQGADA